jgi:hypothetical protein
LGVGIEGVLSVGREGYWVLGYWVLEYQSDYCNFLMKLDGIIIIIL